MTHNYFPNEVSNVRVIVRIRRAGNRSTRLRTKGVFWTRVVSLIYDCIAVARNPRSWMLVTIVNLCALVNGVQSGGQQVVVSHVGTSQAPTRGFVEKQHKSGTRKKTLQ